MRIGIITGEFPPMQGGMGDYTLMLAREMAALGHEIHILTSRKAYPFPQEPGLTVQASVDRWGRWSSSRQSGSNGRRGDTEALEWVRKNKIGVVNIQYEPAAYNMQAAVNFLPRNLLNSVAVVTTTFHDLLVPYLFPKAGRLRKWVVYQMARDSSGIIVTNIADENELTHIGNMPLIRRVPIGSNIAVKPPADYDRQQWREQLRIPPDAFLVGHFGFVNANKGVDTLAHALRLAVEKNLNVHLLMIGGAVGDSDVTNIQQADQAQQLIGGLGIARRVHWTGFIQEEEVSGHLLACDALAFPYKDGASLRHGTLMAALAHGCAVITTFPQGETPELTERQVRFVPPENPHRLAEAIYDLARDDRERARLGHAAAEMALNFRWDSIAATTVQFFEELLSARIRETG